MFSLWSYRDPHLKRTTVDDLRKFAAMFRDGMKQNNICVFGSEAKLTEDKALFKTTIRPIE